MENDQSLAVVIPTLGDRPQLLERAIRSLFLVNKVNQIIVVSRKEIEHDLPEEIRAKIRLEVRSQLNQTQAINLGLELAETTFFSWIGDDDTLCGNFRELTQSLAEDTKSVMAFGKCEYITKEGAILATSKFGSIASCLFKFGPNLIPQPATTFKREILLELNGVCDEFSLAFDQDLYHRILKKYPVKYIAKVVAQYNFDSDTLTRRHRFESLRQSFKLRMIHGSVIIKMVNLFTLVPTVVMILITQYILKSKKVWGSLFK